MSYDDAINALSVDALRFVKDGHVLGLGSGRAATAFVKSLGRYIKSKGLDIHGIPTSLQIKMTAQKCAIPLIESDQIEQIDTVFDGADQIDANHFLVKGGGGALLRENILISSAKKVVIMADKTKFVKNINMPIPVEVHLHARNTVAAMIKKIDGVANIRTLHKGYPFFTENGNIILDCDFGVIKKPKQLAQTLRQMPGVMEAGIFTRRPDVIYKAKTGGSFEIIQ